MDIANRPVPGSGLKPLTLAIRAVMVGGLAASVVMENACAKEAVLPVPLNPAALASQGSAIYNKAGNLATIKQTTDRATLEWKSFNIGAGDKVIFDQPSSSSVALNNIHQADPSQIMGSLKANGQVYLVNQNGFVFGKDSQVNVNALVASTLGVTQEVFERGITKAFDLNNAAALQGNGEVFLKNEQGDFLLDQSGQKIKIQILIEPGASIKTDKGGRVIIAAPVIDNQGSIETPDGQTILAAAKDKVYLQEAGSDSNVRGLLVEVETGGEVNNVGKVLAERGNASLIGFAVNQKGKVSATTSVNLNGTVRLMAREGIQNPTGTGGKLLGKSTLRTSELDDGLGKTAHITLEGGSLTSVDLDADKQSTAIDAQAQLKSNIEISAHDVLVKDQSAVTAHSGNIDIAAVDNPSDPKLKGNARVYLESGSKVDASGVKNVSLPMERNVVEVELRKNELRDAPEQRNGVLFGQKVKVDLRDAELTYDQSSGELTSAKIPVADIKGAVDRIARNIDERSTAGGNITLASSGDVVTQAGSVLDFSGGSVAYRDGVIATTQLVSEGQVIDIAKADPNRHYDGIVGQVTRQADKWGVKQTWQVPGLQTGHVEAGYVEGKAGGQLTVQSYEAALDGALNGQTVAGSRQRQPQLQAAASSVTLDLSRGNLFGRQDIEFSEHKLPTPAFNEAISRKSPTGRQVAALTLDPALFQRAGVGHVTIRTNGSVAIDAKQTLALPDSAQLRLEAAGVDIQGSIVAHSGDVQLQPVLAAGVLAANPITLGASAAIDVSGVWLNDWLNSQQGKPLQGNAAIEGGSVSLLTERGDLTLRAGSRIDASGGAWLQSRGSLTAGKGGRISLTAATQTGGGAPSSLLLDGQLSAWGLTQGGSLNLVSNQVLIGAVTDFTSNRESASQPLLLSPNFFQQGGFADYSMAANVAGLTVADNTLLQPVQRNRQLLADAANAVSGTPLAAMTDVITLPETQRQATDLHLRVQGLQSQNRDALLRVGKNALIRSDRQGTVTLESDASVVIDGKIEVPAGTINVNVTTPGNGDSGFFASQGIWLGQDSQLLTYGVFAPASNALGLTMGEVLPGGAINLTASRGYIVSAPGSLLDASGTRHAVDFLTAGASSSQAVSKTIASPGGSIHLTAAEGIISEVRFNARGGDGAAGGQLSVELDGSLRNKPEVPVAGGVFPDDDNAAKPRSIEISQNATSPSRELSSWPVPIASELNGRGLFNISQLNAAGASELALKVDATAANRFVGSIVFDGDLGLNAQRSIVLDAPSLKTVNNAVVTLNTDYALLGSSKSRLDTSLGQGQFSTIVAPEAVAGNGRLTVNANAIDLVGGLSFNGFGNVALHSRGDVRTVGIRTLRDTKDFRGELKLAGDLTISAAQIYPTTLSDYTITLGGMADNTVTLLRSSDQTTAVMSAAGRLTIHAPNILQQGVLKAPFGELSLNADNSLQLAPGSLTSVSAEGWTIPFGQVSGGLNWLYPLDATGAVNLLLETPPEKRLTLTGSDVTLSKGATVDLRGGGDLYAYEFIPGPGGSQDVLDPNSHGFKEKYAVMPALANALTPLDPLELRNAGLKVGDSVYLSAGSGLSAGWYSLLPAHYALLPGAYLVTPQAGSQDMQPGQSYTDYTGAAVVSGRYGVASAGIANARWQGFAVEQGSIARSRSEFKDYSANRFFSSNLAAQLPKDAGGLSIEVINSLGLHAELRSAAASNGRGGQVDISAEQLAIVGRREELAEDTGARVVLLADDLNALNAPSLLLGGVREQDKRGQRMTVSAQTLAISGSTQLTGPEILLAAKDQLLLASGAQLISRGRTRAAVDDVYVANNTGGSDGALLRLSSDNQLQVIRDQAVIGNQGVLTVEAGVRLAAEGSMLLESTRNTVFAGDIAMQGGSLALKSSRISVGDAPAGTSGLVLHDTAFNLDELLLSSASDLDIYGGVKLDTQHLRIDAAQINGFDNAGATATIRANTLRLSNTQGLAADVGNGSGQLAIEADNVELGSGAYAIEGFQRVTISAKQAIKGLGQQFDANSGDSHLSDPGALTVGGDLQLTAGHFVAGNGATVAIDAGVHSVALNAGQKPASVADIGLGGRWSIKAGSINGNGRFDLPAGSLELHATNENIDLNAGAAIDLSARDVLIGEVHNDAAAGSLWLTADAGNVSLHEGATINLGAVAGDAGLLTVKAPHGLFDWQGTVEAHANRAAKQGRLALELARFEDEGFATLNQKRAASGFGESLTLNLHRGDLLIGESDQVRANRIDLAALQGRVAIAGTLETPAAANGSIAVYGEKGIALAETGRIKAADGQVLLDTVHRNDADSGLLDLASAGGVIDVSGSSGKGSVHLRTGRDVLGHVAATPVNAAILGANPQRATFEAARVYEGVDSITRSNIAQWKVDTAQFMADFGAHAASPLQWLPGLDIRSAADLTLANTWDFLSWRYADAKGQLSLPGYLTLRAPGNLYINASLSDALASGSLPGDSRVYQDMIQPGPSWSYQLIAGGNIELAPTYANPGVTQVVVRTGTGSIDLKSGADIRFVASSKNTSAAAAIYTVGTVAAYTRNQLLQGLIPGVPERLPSESDADYLNRLDPALMNSLLRFGYLDDTRIGSLFQKAEFPTQGGDISLKAAGDIQGIRTGQKISDWLVRSGTLAENKRATLWGINISGDRSNPSVKGIRNFNQNLATLGGGDVSIEAGGSIRNLSAMLPTTGKPFGTVSSLPNQWLANDVVINGGGDLRMTAGDNIVGGEYFVARGQAEVNAGGGIGAAGSATVLELGDAAFNLQARQDITLAGVYNPTLLKQTQVVGGESRFFSYGANSGLDLVSLAGNITLQNTAGEGFEYAVYPETLIAKALTGDISIDKSMTLFPDAEGQLALLANNNIRSAALAGQTVSVNMSDADPSLLPQASNAASSLEGSLYDGLIRARERLDSSTPRADIIHASQPIHLHDTEAVKVVANLGNIAFASGSDVSFFLPKAATFQAGHDIRNLSFSAQNLSPNDMTRVEAGRDIIFDTQISDNGVVLANDSAFKLSGPGRLQILAGNDINLGSAVGVLTLGNIVNTALGDGANIDLLTGLAGTLDITGFIKKYAEHPEYQTLLQAYQGVEANEQRVMLPTVLKVMFKEIQASASAAAAAPERQRAALYQRGFDAIKSLFPDATYSGDLSLVFSQIKTLDGGDINLLVPGGNVDVGLAGRQGGVSKSADSLGIVVQQQGNLNALVQGNFNVNQSRVFTLAGGDLTVWSSKGSIDAGKGAKSAIAAPPPQTTVDEKGNIVTIFPPIVSGSGIQAVGDGLVTLAAPEGIVDAGEAGISGGQIVIAATAVVGASNISASGGTVGVPSSVAPVVSVAGADSAAANAAKSATQMTDGNHNQGNDSKEAAARSAALISVINADVVGYGDCSEEDVRNGKPGCGG